MTEAPFYGKYRGVVTDNVDPMQIGRIKARVPDVTGIGDGGWALPCVPCSTGRIPVPEVSAQVWIEYEHGDPEYPVWTGCWWPNAADVPAPALEVESGTVLVATAGGHTILIDDSPGHGGITLQSATGANISVTDAGIVINNGAGASITLIGPQVSVNNGALEIT